MYQKNIQKIIDLFSDFPTIGQRTAARFVFYLIKLPQQEVDFLIDSIKKLKETTRLCSFCFNPFENENEYKICEICNNQTRDKKTICIVEREADLNSIETAKKYNGLYFILGQASYLLKNSESNTKIKELEERIKNPKNFGVDSDIIEVIIATNFTYEGESAGLFIERKLKALQLAHPLKITHLAKGLPSGAEIEYADQDTISSAFEGRK